MEKYTNEEKQMLLSAIDHFIDAGQRARQILTGDDKNELVQNIWKIQDLRIKLIIDINPIKIKTEDMGNKNVYDSWYFYCHLCGKSDRFSFPENPVIDNHHICSECFKKYSPEEFQKTSERNTRFFDDQSEAEEPADKSWKNDLPF